eukprot:gnl/TRDRNA2_/TRDRNA2_41677_c0_seq1.p1 gnl/TRDRNA2_/TRDRNA2_41677_c0~~gnl/TRDRNA2_/TRDRNA2_41677_c0_seq1.p1  ORF type:complete len:360 (-),score=45.00 gnl/TRDRNA2_/TRDRNA2_41677_c0_seq1:82-1161(-)
MAADAKGPGSGEAPRRDAVISGPMLPFVMVFGGCMSAIVCMEYVLKGDPKAGNLLTLTEFFFVTVISIPGRLEPNSLSLRPLLASKQAHAVHAVFWVAMSILVNYAFSFNISVPIHTLFRSCNVIASVALGFAVFGQRYSLGQLVCVCVITVGIFLGTLGDSKKFSCADCDGGKHASKGAGSAELSTWAVGVGILVCVQLLQAALGHLQAVYYTRFAEKGPRNALADEFLFTSHIVSFFPLIFLWDDIARAFRGAIAAPPMFSVVPIPDRIVWLVLNNIAQTVCIKGVFRLTAHCSPLTVNIVLSVRKFLSVLFSIAWFGNPCTYLHAVATVLIFGGVFAYSNFSRKSAKAASAEKKTS